eukprot:evm.model.NODE_19166_length_72781_cov_34.074345.4
MQADGNVNEEQRRTRVEQGRDKEKEEAAKETGLTVETRRGGEKEVKPEFLQKMGAQVYMGGEETLVERMDRLKHTRQRNRGGEAGFL